VRMRQEAVGFSESRGVDKAETSGIAATKNDSGNGGRYRSGCKTSFIFPTPAWRCLLKLDVDFCDDKTFTARDWDRLCPPARSWRHVDPPTLSRREVAKCGLIGLGLLVCVFGAIVVMFCAL
jgi:hypothetical protein